MTDTAFQQQNPSVFRLPSSVFLSFTKMQGVGNDFVVVDGRENPGVDRSALAMAMCDRKTGIGADGLLVLDAAPTADFAMQMFNPDGSSDVCGNGLRCIVRYAAERGIIASDTMQVETRAGIRAAGINREQGGQIESVTVDMGLPRFTPADIPMRVTVEPVINYVLELANGYRLPVTVLSTGSTHAVIFVKTLPDDDLFFAVSPQVEHHAVFPERTSLMWCECENEARLRLRIWERGAGETWGCGTGACAAAVAAILHSFARPGRPLTVASKGGELIIEWQPEASIRMTGPAHVVYEGQYPLSSGQAVHAAASVQEGC